jgi:hypothetical protein
MWRLTKAIAKRYLRAAAHLGYFLQQQGKAITDIDAGDVLSASGDVLLSTIEWRCVVADILQATIMCSSASMVDLFRTTRFRGPS